MRPPRERRRGPRPHGGPGAHPTPAAAPCQGKCRAPRPPRQRPPPLLLLPPPPACDPAVPPQGSQPHLPLRAAGLAHDDRRPRSGGGSAAGTSAEMIHRIVRNHLADAQARQVGPQRVASGEGIDAPSPKRRHPLHATTL